MSLTGILFQFFFRLSVSVQDVQGSSWGGCAAQASSPFCSAPPAFEFQTAVCYVFCGRGLRVEWFVHSLRGGVARAVGRTSPTLRARVWKNLWLDTIMNPWFRINEWSRPKGENSRGVFKPQLGKKSRLDVLA